MPEPSDSSGVRPRVLQMRLVVEAPDYEAALAFYRDALGASEELTVHGDNGRQWNVSPQLLRKEKRAGAAQGGNLVPFSRKG